MDKKENNKFKDKDFKKEEIEKLKESYKIGKKYYKNVENKIDK